ncbi:acyltransferase-domain-containing protein [Hesseltinella vesiculosa]|uniref:Acyltransferase-domain-containing protein n=1 Tax=Hesseltinella vesiculosa TaxID=101127 RepID=A0A1X2GJE7_9FUNG|nr:acyltransferase-domain-containing protein [Hesseltinella vesiculosa]
MKLSVIVNILIVNFGLFYQSTCVVLGQLLSLPLLYTSRAWYLRYIAFTMNIWSQSLIAVVQYFAPAYIELTIDPAIAEQDKSIVELQDDEVRLRLPKRAIVTANHQLLADWVYIWCLSYLARAHDSIKILLKASLKNLPVYGLGMRFFDFIFLQRKLADDQATIVNNLEQSKKDDTPLWLVLFPEGTVVSKNTRQRSKAFADKNNLNDFLYTLLPRSTGLRLCLQTLEASVEYLYDLTICYPDVQAGGTSPEDMYTIPGIFFFNKQPTTIHMYLRRYRVKDIPVENEDTFNQWVYDRWLEKDHLMAAFYKQGYFNKDAKAIGTPIRLSHPLSLIQPTFCLLPYLAMISFLYYFIFA